MDEATNQVVKMHKVEVLVPYRFPNENKEWVSLKKGDKIELHDKFYANFKKLGIVKDAK